MELLERFQPAWDWCKSQWHWWTGGVVLQNPDEVWMTEVICWNIQTGKPERWVRLKREYGSYEEAMKSCERFGSEFHQYGYWVKPGCCRVVKTKRDQAIKMWNISGSQLEKVVTVPKREPPKDPWDMSTKEVQAIADKQFKELASTNGFSF